MSKLVIPGVIAQSGNGGGGGDVPDNVYTQDNLVAGKDISITLVPQPVIDEYTTRLCHFDDSVADAISGAEAWPDTSISYGTGKFDKGRYASASGNGIYMIPSVSYNSDITVDLWVAPLNHNGDVVDEIFFQSGSSIPSAVSSIVKLYNPSGSNHKIEIGKTWSGTGSAETIQWTDTSIMWGNFFHIVFEKDVTNGKVYFFANGKKIYEHAHTASIGDKGWYAQTTGLIGAAIDEARISNIIRWTTDFEPFSVPYAASAGDPIYQINNTQQAPDLSAYLQNTATGTNALTITDNNVSTTANDSIIISPSKSNTTSGNYSTVLGNNAGGGNEKNITALGYSAQVSASFGTAVGSDSRASGNTSASQPGAGTALGYFATATGGLSCGSMTNSSWGIAIGRGYNPQARVSATSQKSIAIGVINTSSEVCSATAQEAIQLGNGTNSTANSFQVFNYQMLDGTTGKIPVERLPSGNNIEVTDTIPTPSSSNVGQVKLYSGTTTSNFTNGYLYQCKLESTLEETVTFDSDKISAPAEMFWFIVKFVLPETYSSVTNGNITYTESANLVTFTFKDADNTVLGQFPGDVGELSAAGFTFNNLTDGDVINFTCFSGMVESYEWEPLIVQESSEIKIYNAPSWSQNTTLFPNCRLSLPNIDDLTEPGIFRVKYTENDENGSFNLDYLCNVSQFVTNGTIVGIFQSLQVIYPSVGNDSGINATLYRTKLSGGTWSNWKSSLVTSVSSNSIYSEYVSAKLFYDTCGNIEALINAL